MSLRHCIYMMVIQIIDTAISIFGFIALEKELKESLSTGKPNLFVRTVVHDCFFRLYDRIFRTRTIPGKNLIIDDKSLCAFITGQV